MQLKTTVGHFISPWQPQYESELLEKAAQVYNKKFNLKQNELLVHTIHGGLEVGLILEKYPNMQAIAFGPNMNFLHSDRELVEIDSVQPTYDFMVALIQKLYE